MVPSTLAVELLNLDKNGPPKVRVLKSFSVLVKNAAGEEVLATVPAGFLSDGASVPRVLHWIFSPFHSRSLVPSVVHDLLLAKRPVDFDYLAIDRAFRDLQKEYRQTAIRRWFLYAGVRIGSYLRGPYDRDA